MLEGWRRLQLSPRCLRQQEKILIPENMPLAATDPRAYEDANAPSNTINSKTMTDKKEINLIILEIGEDLKLDECAPTRNIFHPCGRVPRGCACWPEKLTGANSG